MSHGSDNTTRELRVSTIARTIGIAPSRLRRWIASGLVRSTLDWDELQTAKLVAELCGRGTPLRRIKQQIDLLRKRDTQQAPTIGFGSALFVRDQDGNPIEWSGQRDFDFGGDEILAVTLPRAGNVDVYFEEALAHEDAGRFEEAAALYRRAIELAPDDCDLHFNLGNTLFASGDIEESISHYKRALVCDPDFEDAQNNLDVAIAARSE